MSLFIDTKKKKLQPFSAFMNYIDSFFLAFSSENGKCLLDVKSLIEQVCNN